MKTIRTWISNLRRKAALTPEQADQLASIKFPCC